MATKLTKAFAEFVGGRGFLFANEGEISQQPGEDYKLARQIFGGGGGTHLLVSKIEKRGLTSCLDF